MKQSVHPNETKCLPQWNKVFQRLKPKVSFDKTIRFKGRNKLFYVVKRTVLCVETSGFLR